MYLDNNLDQKSSIIMLEAAYHFIVLYRLVLGSIELLCYPLFRWLEDGQRSLSTKQPLPATIAIVCATVASGASLAAALPTWQANKPTEIWIVTNALAYSSNEKCLADFLSDKVRLVQCSQTNKRAQLCEGFKRTTSEFIVICDDDTVWTPNVLKKLIQPLQRDARVGAVFPEVKFRPGARVFTLWETMSALRLSGDAIDIRTSMLFDGGVFCASGTTAAYRGKVLRDTVFLRSFPNELWMKKQLNAGDDQSLTLWLANHDWNCRVVADDGLSGCSVLTSPRTDWKHLSQLMRWSRSDWQACLNATMASDAIWRKYPYTAWSRLTWCTGSFSFIIEALYLYSQPWTSTLIPQLLILQASRLIRYTVDLISFPERLVYIPCFILYLYAYQAIRVYSLFTISNTNWS